MKIRPTLASDHPGYYGVVLALLFVHAALAVDALARDHGTAFDPLRTVLGGSLVPYAVLHVLCVVLIVWGLYAPTMFVMVRFGSAVSIATFNAAALCFAIAAFENPTTSFTGAIAFFGLSFISYLAVKEPRYNPASATRLLTANITPEILDALGLSRPPTSED